MFEDNTDALQQEFEGMVSGESAQEPETQTPEEQIEMIELALGEQKHKIPLNAEFPVKHNGQIHNTPLEKLFTAWRERSHYDDKFKGLKEERTKFEQERGDFDQFQELRKKYGDIQAWSEANPEQWNALWEMFQNRDQHLSQTQGDSYTAKELAALREELSGLKQVTSKYEEMMQRSQEKEDVESVNQEIEAFKKEFPDIDLGEKDLDGIPLQDNIINFGIKNNLPDFESAALKFLKSRLVQTAEMRGRKDTVEKVKRDHSAGVVGRSNTPFTGKDVDPKRMNGEELKEAALAEFEQLLSQQ
jgi:hypothetical protein